MFPPFVLYRPSVLLLTYFYNSPVPFTFKAMVRHLLALIMGLGFSSLVCAQTNASIQFDGTTRNYIYYIPTSYTQGQSLPLLFVLHGASQTGQRIMDVSAFNDIAESEGFIAIYPDGINTLWNAGFDVPGASTADDVGLIVELVNQFHAQYSIDLSRVYSCGLSNGGYLSHRLACEAPICFAGIASVAGSIAESIYDNCNPPNNLAVMQIHGTADLVVSYAGGLAGKSVDDIIDLWVGENSCSSPPTVISLPNTDPLDLSTVEKSVYNQCDDNTNVVLLKVNGGGHQWPGTSDLFGGVGTLNKDINASQEIWNFLKNYRCAATTNLNEIESLTINVYPNPSFGMLTIELPYQEVGAKLQILDATGQVVEAITFRDHSTNHFDIDLPPGMYFAAYKSNSTLLSRKVMIF